MISVAGLVELVKQPPRVEMDGCPLVPRTSVHAVLEGDHRNSGVVDQFLDVENQPKDAIPGVFHGPGYLLLEEEKGDICEQLVDGVGGNHPRVIIRKSLSEVGKTFRVIR